MDLGYLAVQLFNGLVNGAFYALLSLGLAVIFGVMRVVNFAHGAVYMLGAFAAYLLLAEREVGRRDSISLMAWGFVFATVFWSVVQPWWSFPAHRVGQTVSLEGRLAAWHLPVWALVLWVIVLGSIVPFTLFVGAMRHLSATRVGIAAMLEPVVATIVAWSRRPRPSRSAPRRRSASTVGIPRVCDGPFAGRPSAWRVSCAKGVWRRCG